MSIKGFYRYVAWRDDGPHYEDAPFYDYRTVGLLAVQADFFQIQIKWANGELIWINIDPADIRKLETKS